MSLRSDLIDHSLTVLLNICNAGNAPEVRAHHIRPSAYLEPVSGFPTATRSSCVNWAIGLCNERIAAKSRVRPGGFACAAFAPLFDSRSLRV